jgi:hypothetical protein
MAAPTQQQLPQSQAEWAQMLGLSHESTLAKAGSLILYSDPGIGKTTEIAKAFQDALYIQSGVTVLRSYESFIRDNPQLGLKMPFYKTIERHFVRKDGMPLSNWFALNWYLDAWLAGAYVHFPGGLVIDEINTLLDRIQEEMLLDPRFASKKDPRKPDPFAVGRELASLMRKVMSLPGRTGRFLTLISHTSVASMHDEGAMIGNLKFKAGPKFPWGSIMKESCADATFVFQMVLRKGAGVGFDGASGKASRFILTEADPLFERKGRDFGIPPEFNLEQTDLRALLRKVGYAV